MSIIQNLSRREILKGAGATTAVVLGAHVVGGSLIGPAKAAATSVQPNLFVSIDGEGIVTITCSRVEMGQGVRTGIPMILADELEADWNRVKIWQAPGDETKYDPAGKDGQNTDGSRSTRHHLDVMRELGASARDVLEQAAAKKWGVDRSEVYAKDHRLYHTGTGNSFDFGEVVDVAAGITPSTDKPKLKDKSQWKYIGKDLPGIDNYDNPRPGSVQLEPHPGEGRDEADGREVKGPFRQQDAGEEQHVGHGGDRDHEPYDAEGQQPRRVGLGRQSPSSPKSERQHKCGENEERAQTARTGPAEIQRNDCRRIVGTQVEWESEEPKVVWPCGRHRPYPRDPFLQ